jgi:hypothetical protein
MPFAKRRTSVVVRRPVTQSPRYLKLVSRVKNGAKRTHQAAARNEQTLLVLAGAAAPALIQRFTGKPLPTVAGIDPAILFGGALIAFGMYSPGKNGERMKSIGLGMAAPGISRAVATGTIKVSGDDDVGDDDVGDDDVGEEI